MNGPTNHFILIYDVTMRRVEVQEFGSDLDLANQTYGELEVQLGPQDAFEIVLVGAESLDMIKRTHSTYFVTGSVQEIVDDFIAQIV